MDMSILEQQADQLMMNILGWENSVLQRIAKRIKKCGRLSLADIKAINNMAVVNSDFEKITKELAKITAKNISQIEKMYVDMLAQQHLENEPLYDYRGKKFVPFKDNRELQAIARAYAKSTAGTMVNIAKTKALCILDHNGNVKGLKKYYTDVLDKAVMQVTTGATDFHTAMRDSIVELGGSGVRVDYGGGVTRRLDTVVRQNLLWGAKQASVEYNEMIGEELGCDGYEVDWHSNPRPSHEFMQGKQFVVGKARTINGVHFDSFDEANERLQDYGCLHYKTPIICGISEPRYSPEELKQLNEQNAKRYTIDGKEYSGYEVTQMQRRLESSVRNEKTTRDLAKASGDNALVKRCNERIKAYQTKYNEISEITGIQGDKKRMSVPRKLKAVDSVTPQPKQNTFVNYEPQKIISLEQLKEKGFSVSKRMEALEIEPISEATNGILWIQEQFPQTKGYIQNMDCVAKYTPKGAFMASTGRTVYFSPSSFGDGYRYYPKSKEFYQRIGAHEAGHSIEGFLISKKANNVSEFAEMWDNHSIAKEVCREAVGKIQKTPYGANKDLRELYFNISSYASAGSSECLAEAIADVYENRDKANPLSLEIFDILKRRVLE